MPFFGYLSGPTLGLRHPWTTPMLDSHFKIVPDIQWTIFRLFFVNSHTRFCFILFYSDPGFSSLQYLPLSFRRNSSNISSRSLQDLQEIFKIFRSFSSVENLSILIITVYLLLLYFFRWQLILSLASFKSPSSLDHFFSKPRGRIICRSVVKSKSPKARSRDPKNLPQAKNQLDTSLILIFGANNKTKTQFHGNHTGNF